jgi:uncharacterized cysteine cluster protein YcgN (CxxCxxCC family)
MCLEYKYRKNKDHACFRLFNEFLQGLEYIPSGELTEFVNCTPHKNLPIHQAYQKTLSEKWLNDKRKPVWTNRTVPEFYHG